jgi:hypothetical protein
MATVDAGHVHGLNMGTDGTEKRAKNGRKWHWENRLFER